ncbi:hypothetical protein AVEN_187341-1 [Araneus ventricosus]|uniref:DDE Tnp4 domain-containing protein n=1 Tax=Araneus ventricosus TaxID=182803 RepID=A0A4Y2Q5V7_ARAVE|nr:hypothetical protein AVEN_187341-1 [Araneus ventricosus]
MLKENTLGIPLREELSGRSMKNPYFLAGDSVFALSENLMKPGDFARRTRQRIFNYRLSRARWVVENDFDRFDLDEEKDPCCCKSSYEETFELRGQRTFFQAARAVVLRGGEVLLHMLWRDIREFESSIWQEHYNKLVNHPAHFDMPPLEEEYENIPEDKPRYLDEWMLVAGVEPNSELGHPIEIGCQETDVPKLLFVPRRNASSSICTREWAERN